MLNLTLLGMLSDSVDAKGGGEVLQLDAPDVDITNYINWGLVQQFTYIPAIYLCAVFTGIVFMVLVYMRMNNIPAFGFNGISYSISRRNRNLKKQNNLIAANQLIRNITAFVESTPLRCDKNNKDYMDYNLKRAGLVLPGKQQMYYEQYNAIKVTITALLLLISLLIMIFINVSIGTLLVILVSWSSAALPTMIIRGIVESKDIEIKNHFMDFYLVLHYSLLMDSSTPLAKLMQSYAKTTDSKVMHQFVAECVNTLDTYGEYNAMEVIARDYREIAQVGKLTRMIKQQFDAADVKQELKGFRAELVRDERYRISEEGDKKVAKVRRSLMLVYILLIQVILSSFAIYLPDMGGLSSLVGG